MLRPTPGDPWGVEQHHWNIGAKENQQLNPGGPSSLRKARTANRTNSSPIPIPAPPPRPPPPSPHTVCFSVIAQDFRCFDNLGFP